MPFLSPLDTRAYKPGESVVLQPFGFEFDLRGKRFRLWVPRGYVTDFASIPWVVNWHPKFDVEGPSRAAAIPHDYGYSNHGLLEVEIIEPQLGIVIDKQTIQFSRAECDEILRMAILDTGRDRYTRWMIDTPYTKTDASLFYAGVRAGGWYPWSKRSGGINAGDFVPDDYWQNAA